jgi:hypothetical protein
LRDARPGWYGPATSPLPVADPNRTAQDTRMRYFNDKTPRLAARRLVGRASTVLPA